MMPFLPPNHQPRKMSARRQHRAEPEQWGQGRGGRPWERLRARVFVRDKYLCQRHLRMGKLVAVELHGLNAGICDHITPVAEGGTDRMENLETLCKSCSAIKTAEESAKGKANKPTPDPL